MLGHICRRWRRIIFGSFRLYFTHGAPVLKTLVRWPALPIIVEYGGSPAPDPLTPEDEDNIMAALEQSDRVCSITLTVTNPLLKKLSAIEGPFLKLEDLVLLSRDGVELTLPSAFGWSTRLRSLRLTRIAFFALPQLLYSSRKLVDLRLHEVFNPWLLSPEALADALSGMAQLRSLSLHFLPTTDHWHTGPSLSSSKRFSLPFLTRLNFRGIAQYLEDLVVRIDAPHLGDIEVTFFNESISDLSKSSEFIDRIEIHKSHCRAYIQISERALAISLTQPAAPTDTCLKLQLFCEPLSRQLDNIAHICSQISDVLFSVEDLHINVTRSSSGQAHSDCEQWQGLILYFSNTKSLHVAGAGDYSTKIVDALQPSKGREDVLPVLQKLRIREFGPRNVPLRKSVVSLMASHRLYGHPIVEYERLGINGGGGTGSPYSRRQHQTLTCFEQYMFFTMSRSRCSPMTSFSTYFGTI